ncbi:MBL fold metallo-hydrolase [Candidatus Kaiserbacteria bacterium]|nr:MBL fold metallo-hydrolase [Candidatus Kaiserbacteria bacterium]
MRILRSLILLVLFFILIGSLDVLPERNVAAVSQSGTCPERLLCVVFLDVGQGDSIFIQSPTETQMLIDGGRGSAVLRPLADVMGFFDKTIDYVLITHPDSDHVGGLVSVFDRYEILHVLRTEKESETAVWQAVEERLEGEMLFARRGQTYDLGGGAVLTILFPEADASDLESNEASIVARLVYGESEFLFMGDAPQEVERKLLEGDIQSDVLKVGHHGSKTSTAEEFIEVVRPTYSIISAGKDNRYGHPHAEVLENLSVSEIKNTADEGSIFMISDGKSIWFK